MRSNFPTVVEPPVGGGHPDDIRDELESRAAAARLGPSLLRPHAEQLAKLVTMYPDAAAIDALEQIREWFWGQAIPFSESAHRESGDDSILGSRGPFACRDCGAYLERREREWPAHCAQPALDLSGALEMYRVLESIDDCGALYLDPKNGAALLDRVRTVLSNARGY